MTAAELFDIILPRIASSKKAHNFNFLEAVQTTADIITRRLQDADSDLIKEDFNHELLADADEITLDSDFLGMVSNSQPWVYYSDDESKYELTPLPVGKKREVFGDDANIPKYYQLRGFTMTVYPATSEDAVIYGEQFSKPTVVDGFDDDLPFDGIFDQVFVDATTKVGREGMDIIILPAFELFVEVAVDRKTNARQAKNITWRYPG